jgi:hypothetical protein
MVVRHTIAIEIQVLRGIKSEDVLYGVHCPFTPFPESGCTDMMELIFW